MDYRIFKVDINDNATPLNNGESDYTADQPRTGLEMNGPDAFGADNTLHLAVPVGMDGKKYIASKVDGVWVLVEDAGLVAAVKIIDDTTSITVKYNEMKVDVLSSMHTTFGTTDPNSASAYLQTWEKMVASPSSYSASGLTAWVVSPSFVVGDPLNDNTKVTNYATECIIQAEDYAIARMVRIQQFRNEKDTILA